MILGVGIDLVDVNGFASLVPSVDAAFVKDHFTAAEREYCESGLAGRVVHYAARYAAKEAFIKALDSAYLFRTAPLGHVDYLEMEVARDPGGRPYLILQGALAKLVAELKVKTFLSIAHDGGSAVAQVVLSCQDV